MAIVLVVGFRPAQAPWAGRDARAPRWLLALGVLAALGGVLTPVGMFTGALTSYGFAAVPAGLLWMLGAGLATIRSG